MSYSQSEDSSSHKSSSDEDSFQPRPIPPTACRRSKRIESMTKKIRKSESPRNFESFEALSLNSPRKRKASAQPAANGGRTPTTPDVPPSNTRRKMDFEYNHKQSEDRFKERMRELRAQGRGERMDFKYDHEDAEDRFQEWIEELRATGKTERMKGGARATKQGLRRASSRNADEEREVREHNLDLLKGSTYQPSNNPRLFKRENSLRFTEQEDDEEFPIPTQYTYPPHWQGDRPDEYFETQFSKLYDQLIDFSQTYFNYPNIADHIYEHGEDLWKLLPDSEKFVLYASQVAQPDPVAGKWNGLLSNNESRSTLVAGIISRVLQKEIFDELLFGAREDQKEAMEKVEMSLVGNEKAYIRTLHRSRTTRTYLSHSPLPPNFWPHLTTLTAKATTLLQPLTHFLQTLPYTPGFPPPSLKNQYLALHQLLSNAAYLSILIRLSPTIFYFSFASLVRDYDAEMHENISPNSYELSQAKVSAGYSEERKTWESKIKKAQAQMRVLISKGGARTSQGQKAKSEFEKLKRKTPRPVNQTHRPGVKIVIFPNVKRHKPGSSLDEEPRNVRHLREMRGDRARLLVIGKVVLFCERRDGEGKGDISLQQFIHGQPSFLHLTRVSDFFKHRKWVKIALISLAGLIITLTVYEYFDSAWRQKNLERKKQLWDLRRQWELVNGIR